MKRGALFMVAVIALVTVVGVGSVYAQDAAVVNIPFTFTFNNQDMAAGKYEVTVSSEGIVTMTPAKGRAVLGPIITRLAPQQVPVSAPTFVFDNMNERYSLSEVWLPMEDGYLLADTKQPHKHHVIKGAKKG